MSEIRPYRDSDLEAVLRIWQEVGWLERDEQRGALARFLAAGVGDVAVLDGEAECLVHTSPGTIHYAGPLGEGSELKLAAITAVTTSPIARRRGFASRLTARALARAAEEGFAVAGLGMFEQGFYDRLGFGSGAYEHELRFDPANLQVAHLPFRAPARLKPEHAADMHEALRRRKRGHGGIMIDAPSFIDGEIGFRDRFYALGYRDAQGRLTHFLGGEMKGEYGPWEIVLLSYETTEQLLELFRLLFELSDQVRSVQMLEPPHVQLQALLREPFRERQRSAGGKMSSAHESVAWMQLRILDLEACIAASRFPGPELVFNLSLSDPVGERLSESSGWSGIGGDYVVTLGEQSRVEPGAREGAPKLVADVGSLTRLWFGVRPASVLAVTDPLRGSEVLLDALDRKISLPTPVAGLEY